MPAALRGRPATRVRGGGGAEGATPFTTPSNQRRGVTLPPNLEMGGEGYDQDIIIYFQEIALLTGE